VLSRGDALEELAGKLEKGVTRLRGVKVDDQLEVEVVLRLLKGRRTVSELVDQIYGVGRADGGFASSYTRVRRAVKRLESRGLVSTNMLGKERPYKLTQYAIINLARIGGEEEQVSFVSRKEFTVYLLTFVSSIIAGVMGQGWIEAPDILIMMVFGAFCYLLGATSILFVRSFRRII
jgi:hypothetical protein